MSRYFLFLLAGILFLSSCVTVLQSLMTATTIVTDNKLIGIWKDSESRTIQVQQVSGTRIMQELQDSDNKVDPAMLAYYGKHYVITYKENNLSYVWFGGLVRLRDQYYISLIPEECINAKGKDEYNTHGHWTTSSIARIEWKDNNAATLHFINGDNIREAVLKGRARIKHEYDPLFDTFVITASSEELQEFLVKYGNNDILYQGGKKLMLSRKF